MKRPPSQSATSVKSARSKIAWAGFSLEVPIEWNVTVLHGDSEAGTMAFSDLEAVRLEVRWQSGSSQRLSRRLQGLVRKMERLKAHACPMDTRESGWRIEHGNRTIFLFNIGKRLYEMSGSSISNIPDSFIDNQTAELYRWRIYGIDAIVPKGWRLKQTVLMPGGSHLEFKTFSSRVLAGSWSMADRLLGTSSLEMWAAEKVPLVVNHPAGEWETRCDGRIFRIRTGGLLRRKDQLLGLRHQDRTNYILWLHTITPPRRLDLAERLMAAFLNSDQGCEEVSALTVK